MVLIDLDTKAWAQDIFGSSQLGDQRLNNRLQKIASQLSASIGSSLASSYNDNEASLEGRYFASVRKCINRNIVLAVEDSTTMSFAHQVREQLGDICNRKHALYRGFMIHTSLLIDGETEETIGMIDQHRWCRDSADRG